MKMKLLLGNEGFDFGTRKENSSSESKFSLFYFCFEKSRECFEKVNSLKSGYLSLSNFCQRSSSSFSVQTCQSQMKCYKYLLGCMDVRKLERIKQFAE